MLIWVSYRIPPLSAVYVLLLILSSQSLSHFSFCWRRIYSQGRGGGRERGRDIPGEREQRGENGGKKTPQNVVKNCRRRCSRCKTIAMQTESDVRRRGWECGRVAVKGRTEHCCQMERKRQREAGRKRWWGDGEERDGREGGRKVQKQYGKEKEG